MPPFLGPHDSPDPVPMIRISSPELPGHLADTPVSLSPLNQNHVLRVE